MTIGAIINLLTGFVLPLVLPNKNKAAQTVALIADAYAVYADVEGHRGLPAIAADTQKLLTDLDAEVGPSVFASFTGQFAKVPATVSDYESGGLALVSNRAQDLGLSAGKIYGVKDGGDADTKIHQIFFDGTFAVVPVTQAVPAAIDEPIPVSDSPANA